jgi:transcriptional regulator with XRE-family HTH domain
MSDDHPFKKWRDGAGLSQVQAAKQIGVNSLTLSRWERGSHLPRKTHWNKIEEVTGITPSTLIPFVKNAENAA